MFAYDRIVVTGHFVKSSPPVDEPNIFKCRHSPDHWFSELGFPACEVAQEILPRWFISFGAGDD